MTNHGKGQDSSPKNSDELMDYLDNLIVPDDDFSENEKSDDLKNEIIKELDEITTRDVTVEKTPEDKPESSIDEVNTVVKENLPKNNFDLKDEIKNFVSHDSDKYISYENRVLKMAILLVLCCGLTLFFALKSFSLINGDAINYNEKSNLDYQVYLKENNFYDTDHLGKDMLYVASLIDHINVDFDYNFAIDKMMDLDLTYDVVAKLRITDNTEKNLFFEKEYVLQEPITEKVGNSASHNVKKNINIDYNYYNALANNFRTSYGLETKSNLLVYFRVKQDNSKYQGKYPIQGNSEMLINIPLSEKAISVQLDYKEVNDSKQVLAYEHFAITNYFFVILALLALVGVVYFTIRLVRLIKYVMIKKSNYDKYIAKLLKEYDRLIVETETAPVINDDINVIKVKKFQELLDVRDNLKLPIKYYIVNEHQKCYFFISHEKELYLLVIKEVDLEGDNKEK